MHAYGVTVARQNSEELQHDMCIDTVEKATGQANKKSIHTCNDDQESLLSSHLLSRGHFWRLVGVVDHSRFHILGIS